MESSQSKWLPLRSYYIVTLASTSLGREKVIVPIQCYRGKIHLLVSKRRGKEEDKSSQAHESNDRDSESTEVTNVTGDDVGGGGNTGGREVSNVLHHVDLRGFSSDEGGRRDCRKTRKTRSQ